MQSFAISLGLRLLSAVLVGLCLLGQTKLFAGEPVASEAQIQQLVQQLGDPDYSVRERAQGELAKLGFAAFEAISAATRHEDLEVATRAKYLLRLIRIEWSRADDPEAVKRALDDYGDQQPEERLKRIRDLARLPDSQGLPAICRLIRYEQSQLLSKLAALEVLERVPSDRAAYQPWTKTLLANLAHSSRPGAAWLKTYIRLREDPAKALAEWNTLVEAEQVALKRASEQTGGRIVTTLLYHLASIQLAKGQADQAEKTAQRAREAIPGKEITALLAHVEMAATLKHRGMFRFAEEEYRHVMRSGTAELAVIAHVSLAEMFHDGGQDLKAAEALEGVFKLTERKLGDNVDFFGRSVGELRSRVSYFQACHWEQQGDRARQRACLDEALRHFPAEIDTLIACHRLPDQPAEYPQRIQGLIAKATANMRKDIENDPDDANAYNQFAWLVGNTGGDVSEALRCAHKAVEMSPENGAFYDTLAHVYAGKGDYANAVKYQTRAVELEPHSGLIVRQLKVFEAKSKGTSNR
jgi:tetratricopeptide (TPR) repeat protein